MGTTPDVEDAMLVDLDGALDVVASCQGDTKAGVATAHDISGLEGAKFDLTQLYDVDGDGNLDVSICEEAEDLGVVWYENPAR